MDMKFKMFKGLAFFVACWGADLHAAPIFESFVCKVGHYTPSSFLMRQWDNNFYQVKARGFSPENLSDLIEFQVPDSTCKFDVDAKREGLFTCQSQVPGTVFIGSERAHYDSVTIQVTYQQEENDYPPMKEKYPVWHQRVITISFKGGDFAETSEAYTKVNVNYYDAKEDWARETCKIDGRTITE